MYHIIYDLEATCWAEERRPERMEIIEIGAVKLASPAGPVLGEFDVFVRPVLEPTLSDFCRELTGITQADVDGAEPFPAVLARLVAWMGEQISDYMAENTRQMLGQLRCMLAELEQMESRLPV